MAKVRADEVLGKAVDTDSVAVPRYDLVAPDGTVVATNVALTLKNPIVQQGMNVDKVAMDECLAASGTTEGTASAFTLVQPNFALFDGALVRIRLHVDSGATPTIDVNGTGAVALMQDASRPLKTGTKAGMWLTFIYSEVLGFFVLQGSGGDSRGAFGRYISQISSLELTLCGEDNPSYTRANILW